MSQMPGEKQVSAASVVTETAVEHRNPWDLAKDIDIPLQNKMNDNAGETCSPFQNTSKSSGSEQEVPTTEMSKEEVAHHETSQPYPGMSTESISEKCSKHSETVSGKGDKPSFKRIGPKMKLPHSLFQKASMAEAELSDFIETSEESDVNVLTPQPSGLQVKEDETPKGEPQAASVSLKRKVPTFGKIRVKSSNRLVSSDVQGINTSRVTSNLHNPKNAKLSAVFDPEIQGHLPKRPAFSPPVHDIQSIEEKDINKTCTEHGETLSESTCTNEGGNQQLIKKPVLCETSLHEKNVIAKEDNLINKVDVSMMFFSMFTSENITI